VGYATLDPGDLRWRLDPESLGFATTEEVLPQERLVGQPRAEEAMSFAISLRRHGYHIYLSGPTGTGRTTYARRRLREAAQALPPARDWLYLPNFLNPSSPRAVSVPPGTGPRYAAALRQLRRNLSDRLPQAFDSDEYRSAHDEVLQRVNEATEEDFESFQRQALDLGFAVKPGPTGLQTIPLKAGQPLDQEALEALSEAERAEIAEASQHVAKLAEAFVRRAHELRRQAQQVLGDLSIQRATYASDPLFAELQAEFPDPALSRHLGQLQERIGDWLPLFVPPEGQEPPADPGWFTVNALVVREGPEAPVVYEPNPSYYNLMGRLDYEGGEGGSLRTGFHLIRPGAIHHANGGYLVIPARELVQNPLAYEGLKRALQHHVARIENVGQQERPMPTSGLRPEPIPLDVQVVLVGPESAYLQLRELDEQFRKLFKVRVDFAPDMENTEENRRAFAAFLAGLGRNQGVRAFSADGAARMLEEAARLAGGRRRLSTRMSEIIELAVEADAFARERGAREIDRDAVRSALAARRRRAGLYEERMLEMIELGTIRIETQGRRVGQVNGLTVLTAGELSFGLPARITARTYAGSTGVVDIEREIQLSGPIHSKGVLTLSGYLGWRFGQQRPLALAASLTIEQNYGGIEGDSASSTELYAILSDLSGLGVRQDIAVTGSVDQAGRIQPIGGVNEKIEGFFAVCQAQGLTGSQGCMIPRQNIDDLMLSDDVVAAVRSGQFHVYAIDTIEQGIELLTGVAAGDEGDAFAPGSVFARVADRLLTYADSVQGLPSTRHPS
jgi:predicted ATP-dependent protease